MNFHEETAGARLRTRYTNREIRESRVISRARSRFRCKHANMVRCRMNPGYGWHDAWHDAMAGNP